MDSINTSREILKLDPGATMAEIDAAYAKWLTFWNTCQINVTSEDQRAAAALNAQRVQAAYRSLHDAAWENLLTEADLFLSRIGGRTQAQTAAVARQTVSAPPPLPKKHTTAVSTPRPSPPPLQKKPIAKVLATTASADWEPFFSEAPASPSQRPITSDWMPQAISVHVLEMRQRRQTSGKRRERTVFAVALFALALLTGMAIGHPDSLETMQKHLSTAADLLR